MTKWILRIVAIVALALIGFWVWRTFFPGPEQLIRRRMEAVARTASFSPNESPLAKLSNAQKLTTFCADRVEITVDVPGQSQRTFNGRDELMQAAIGARSVVSALKVEFFDLTVTLGPDRTSAVVNLTAKGKIPEERDFMVQELKFTFKKINGDWLINRVETVKTLL